MRLPWHAVVVCASTVVCVVYDPAATGTGTTRAPYRALGAWSNCNRDVQLACRELSSGAGACQVDLSVAVDTAFEPLQSVRRRLQANTTDGCGTYRFVSCAPTASPTFSPTDMPTVSPTSAPTVAPTSSPTQAPTQTNTNVTSIQLNETMSFGATGTVQCQDGSRHMTINECEEYASPAVITGVTKLLVGNLNESRPVGCSYEVGASVLYFNTAARGVPSATVSPVCRKQGVVCKGGVCVRVVAEPMIEPAGLSGILMRLVPAGGAIFMCFFGRNVANMVRLASVFWASAATALVPALAPYIADPNTPITVTAFMGVLGGMYAGCLGAFAAIKRRNFGIAVQGLSVGYILASVIQGYVAGHVVEAAPELEEYMEWVSLGFSGMVGGVVAKLALKYEDAISVMATATIGSYTLLQVLCSYGLPFADELSVTSLMAGNGAFGCRSWQCNVALSFHILLAIAGSYNQIKINMVMRRMEQLAAAGGEFTPGSLYEALCMRINTAMAVLYKVNEVVKELSTPDLTRQELEAMAKRHMEHMTGLATVVSDCSLCVLAVSLWAGIVEIISYGVFKEKLMIMLGMALFCIGSFTMWLGYYSIQTHRLQAKKKPRWKRLRNEQYVMMVLPLVPMSALLMLFVKSIDDDSALSISSLREYMQIDKLDPVVLFNMKQLLPTVNVNQQLLITSLCVSGLLVVRELGGITFVIKKVTNLSLLTNGIFGIVSAGSGGLLKLASPEEGVMYDVIAYIGLFFTLQSMYGARGVGKYDKDFGRAAKILKLYKMSMYLTVTITGGVFAAAVYYVQELDSRIHRDWEHIQPHAHGLTVDEFVMHAKSSLVGASIVGGTLLGFQANGILCTHLLLGGKLAGGLAIGAATAAAMEVEAQANTGKGMKNKKRNKKRKNQMVGVAGPEAEAAYDNPLSKLEEPEIAQFEPDDSKTMSPSMKDRVASALSPRSRNKAYIKV